MKREDQHHQSASLSFCCSAEAERWGIFSRPSLFPLLNGVGRQRRRAWSAFLVSNALCTYRRCLHSHSQTEVNPPRPNYTNALLRSDDIPQRAACSAAFCFCAKRAFVLCDATAQHSSVLNYVLGPTNRKFLGLESFPCKQVHLRGHLCAILEGRGNSALQLLSGARIFRPRPSTIDGACIARSLAIGAPHQSSVGRQPKLIKGSRKFPIWTCVIED